MSSYIEIQISDSERDTFVDDASLVHPVVCIELSANCDSIHSVLDNLIKPALAASGFASSSVDRIIYLLDTDED